MRIAIVGTELAPLDSSSGALEKLSIGWAGHLYRMGLNVSLFSSARPRTSPPVGTKLFTFNHARELSGMFRRYQIDIAIFNNRPLWNADGIVGRINIFHNYDDAWALPSDFDELSLVRALKDSRNLAVSQTLASATVRRFPDINIDVLYPFVDDAFLLSNGSRLRGRIKQEPLRLLFPNRTLEKKGLRWLIDTIDNHLSTSVSLTVVHNISPWKQETAEHRELIALAKSRPYVKIEQRKQTVFELINMYRRHDVIVTPSIKEEGLGLIPLEAQALGIPVVASNLGGLKESVFQPNRLVPVNAQLELAEAIVEVSSISEQKSTAIASHVAKKFSGNHSSDNLKKEIERLLHRDSLC